MGTGMHLAFGYRISIIVMDIVSTHPSGSSDKRHSHKSSKIQTCSQRAGSRILHGGRNTRTILDSMED
jgi:hypothetical protein